MVDADTLIDAQEAVRAKRVSAVELVGRALDRIDRVDAKVQAFLSVERERAIERAKAVDEGKVTGELAGVAIAIKDNLCTTFGTTTCGSKMLENFRSPYDATVVKKLESAGGDHRRQDEPG